MNYSDDSWRAFLTEARLPTRKPRKLLRELTEDEYELIRDAVDSMGPDELAFNELFEGKTRVVLSLPTLDTETDLGKFVDMFREMGYNVNWEKGLVSSERELKDGSINAMVAQLAGDGVPPPKKKKVQMKIGKFWGKIYELASKREVLSQKVFDHVAHPSGQLRDGPGRISGTGRIDRSEMYTGNMIQAALDEQEQKRFQQIADQLEMYLGPNRGGATMAMAKKNQEYWQQNAEYIKKNINNLENDEYSIVISRDPVDILRMSDFDRITSCHSPPSRGQSSDSSYFRCALAEAHGHGAIAYVVKTEDLLHMTNTSNIESAEQEIQEGEIFGDAERESDDPGGSTISPRSRVRIRQVRVHSEFMRDGSEIAVPERRVYGVKIPGFRDRVFNWAKESQATAIEGLSTEDRLIKYGGSYEDNDIKGLVQDLTGIEFERIGQNSETEESLPDLDDLTGTITAEQAAVDALMDEWNYRYQACEIAGEVRDDGGEGYYVDITEGKMKIVWDTEDWESLPTDSATMEGWMDELHGFEWNWANAEAWGSRIYSGRSSASHPEIVMTIEFDITQMTEHEVGYLADSSEFEDLCVEVNRIDDMLDTVKQEITRMAKRDGFMAGGALNAWGLEIENGDVDYYEWDTTVEEGYEHGEIENISASHTTYPAVPEGMSVQDGRMVLESRDFTIPLRKALVDHAWIKTMTKDDDRHYPNFRVYTEELRTASFDRDNPDIETSESNIRLVLTFSCTESSTDAQVNSMMSTCEEWEDEEVLDAAIQEVFNQIVGTGLTGRGDMDAPAKESDEWDEESEKRFQALAQKEKEPSPEVTNESIVKNWKNFLNS